MGHYQDLLQRLYQAGYQRIERDDRLLDIFPDQTRDKGIELWEYWEQDEVRLVRIREPFDGKQVELFIVARPQLESLLHRNQAVAIEDFERNGEGGEVIGRL